jgi:K+-transporting ATPase ATPase A chain
VLLAGFGVIQNLNGWQLVTTVAEGRQAIPGGLVASWEPIKLMSGDGGGFFNANSAHPFENPTAVTNVIEIVLMLLVPVACIRMFGRMVGDRRQGWALLVVAGVLFAGWTAGTLALESHTRDAAPVVAHAAMEGKQTEFGVPGSALFGVAATASADGAANSSYDSFTALGGGMLMSAMMLGEIIPGGVGSGLYGLLMVALIGVFLAGLMISRAPQYLRKRIRAPEVKMVALCYLATPAALLAGAAVAIALPAGRAAIFNPSAHGLSEVMYAFTSAANSNGSAFGGLSGNTPFYNTLLALVMLLGRYVPMVFVLGLAGRLAGQRLAAGGPGSLRTTQPTFVVLVIGVAVILIFLTFLPALALGPLADGLH